MNLLKPQTVPHKIAGLPSNNVTILLFGPTGSGKTAQIGEVAEYLFKNYNLITRLYSCDPGGWLTVAPYIELGIIELVPYFGDSPWHWIDAAVQGKKLVDGKFVPGIDPKVGLYAYEGMTSMADKAMLWMSGQAGVGVNIGGGGAFSFTAKSSDKDNKDIKIGSNNQAHYSVAQQQVYDKSAQSQLLPGIVLWTAGDRRGEDDVSGGVVGPQVAGKALTGEVPRWFNLTFRIGTEAQIGQPTKHVLYTDSHVEMNAKMAKGISNSRIPLAGGETVKIPDRIEPASVIKIIEMLNLRQQSATDAIRKRLGL